MHLVELVDIPEINGARLIPFTKEAVPVIDIAAKKITVLRAAVEFDAEDPTASELSPEEMPGND